MAPLEKEVHYVIVDGQATGAFGKVPGKFVGVGVVPDLVEVWVLAELSVL